MAVAFDVLAEPHRRQILDLLLDGDRSVGELVAHFDLAQPSVSKHLRILRDAGLVTARVEGQRRIYRVEPAPLRQIDDWLAPYRRRWQASLDALERHLDDMDHPKAEELS
jgi:DNA-binding transcriptional ArsR family regulator